MASYRRKLVAAILLTSVLGGCVQGTPTTPPPLEPDAPLADLSPDEIADAVRFRETFGLQADETYIRQVAADPVSEKGRDIFGVPLLPHELESLQERQRAAEASIPIIVRYGEDHPAAFAGFHIDQDRGGIIVVGIVGDPTVHKAALQQELGGEALVEFVPAEWSQVQLKAFADRIEAEGVGWMADIPATTTALGADTVEGKVILEVTSPHPDAEQLIRAHFGDPTWLTVISDGTGIGLIPTGDITVAVVNRQQVPMEDLRCVFIPDWNGEPWEPFERDWFTDVDGLCHAELPATGYWVRIEAGSDGARETLAITRAVITAGRNTSIEVGLEQP